MVVESQTPQARPVAPSPSKDTTAQRKKLLDAIGADAYNGVDLFEGTTPAPVHRESRPGTVDLGDPADSGVDISSLMGGATKMWDLMK